MRHFIPVALLEIDSHLQNWFDDLSETIPGAVDPRSHGAELQAGHRGDFFV
jgi:hypothetical protein